MTPENPFSNPSWHSLRSLHRHLAMSTPDSCKYPADVSPFGAVSSPTTNALLELRSLMLSGESIWIFGDSFPAVPHLVHEQTIQCLQMILPFEVPAPKPDPAIEPLTCDQAGEMVALTDVAFPGFFRPRTCLMGPYHGIRSDDGKLIAMCGERMNFTGHAEISGLCTHPEYRGKGYAARLIWKLVQEHRRNGIVSWLHVASTNQNAIALYYKLGFQLIQEVTVQRFTRRDDC